MEFIAPQDAVCVDDAGVRGRGLFAIRALMDGDVIAESPVLPFDEFDARLIAGTALGNYYITWPEEDGKAGAMPIGVVAFVNHSDNPNADMLRDPLKQVVQLVACVEIQEGVEVTVDYGHPFRCVGCGARG